MCKKNKIRILIDAEQTYRQPAIDVMAIYLSHKYNVDSPIFYNTYQFYLKRTPDVFLEHKKLAEEGNYFFAAKCVRGAYIPSETARANELKYELPIVDSKEKTDLEYNLHTKMMLAEVQKKKKVALVVATHNMNSCVILSSLIKKENINIQNVHFAQLAGMSDHLTIGLSKLGMNSCKLLPFGPVDNVSLYLIRRVQENGSALSGTQLERQLMWKELKRRIRNKTGF